MIPVASAFAELLDPGELVLSIRVDRAGVHAHRWFTRLISTTRTYPEELLTRLSNVGVDLSSARYELASAIPTSRCLFVGGDGQGGVRFYVEHRSHGSSTITAWKWNAAGTLTEVTEYHPLASRLAISALPPLLGVQAEPTAHLLAEVLGPQTFVLEVLQVTARGTLRNSIDAAVPELSEQTALELVRRLSSELGCAPPQRLLGGRQGYQRISLGCDRCGHPFLTLYQQIAQPV